MLSDDLQQVVEDGHQALPQVGRGALQGLLPQRRQHWRRVRGPLLRPHLRRPRRHRGVLL